jgi:hypothetical protein
VTSTATAFEAREPSPSPRRLEARAHAEVLASRARAGAPDSQRALVLDLDRADGHCVLATGDRPVVVWPLGLDGLYALAATSLRPTSHADPLGGLRAEARRIVATMRLAAVRGSIAAIVVADDPSSAAAHLVSASLRDALLEIVAPVHSGPRAFGALTYPELASAP